MESFFATLKKEKLYRIRTERMPMTQVKSIVFRYIMTYYNRQRIYTANPAGHVSSGRQRPGRINCRFWVFTLCTVLDFSSDDRRSVKGRFFTAFMCISPVGRECAEIQAAARGTDRMAV
jgi:hypothetical protein